MKTTLFLLVVFASICYPQQNGISYEFKTDKKVYQRNETVQIRMCITNRTVKTVRLPYLFSSTSLKIDKEIDDEAGSDAGSDSRGPASLIPDNDSNFTYRDVKPNDSVCIKFKSYSMDFPKNKSGRCVFSGYLIPMKMARIINDSIVSLSDRITFDSLEIIINK
jgi:hypothetical protein